MTGLGSCKLKPQPSRAERPTFFLKNAVAGHINHSVDSVIVFAKLRLFDLAFLLKFLSLFLLQSFFVSFHPTMKRSTRHRRQAEVKCFASISSVFRHYFYSLLILFGMRLLRSCAEIQCVSFPRDCSLSGREW